MSESGGRVAHEVDALLQSLLLGGLTTAADLLEIGFTESEIERAAWMPIADTTPHTRTDRAISISNVQHGADTDIGITPLGPEQSANNSTRGAITDRKDVAPRVALQGDVTSYKKTFTTVGRSFKTRCRDESAHGGDRNSEDHADDNEHRRRERTISETAQQQHRNESMRAARSAAMQENAVASEWRVNSALRFTGIEVSVSRAIARRLCDGTSTPTKAGSDTQVSSIEHDC